MSCAACSQLKGERFMHSIDHYDTLRRGREELLRQAEQERMARAALLKRKTNWTVHREVANWLGIHLVRWGKKLERFGTFAEA
jgi:hypothetical protein